MQVGMIGLGRMGANMVRRFMRGGHQCVVHDVSKDAVQALAREGADGATSLEAVPAHVLAAALFERFASQGEADFQDRRLSAMRLAFRGHLEKGPGA